MTESKLLKAVLQYLAAKRVFAWRNNTGAFVGEYRGKKRFVRFGIKGGPDVLGVLPGGRLLGIECKRPGGILSDAQADWISEVNRLGGCAFMVDDIDMAMARIDHVLGET